MSLRVNKKLLFITAGIILLLILACLGTACFIYWNNKSNDLAVEKLTDSVVLPSGDIKLGQDITAYAEFKTPWHREPLKAAVLPGDGSQLAGEPEIIRESTSLDGFSKYKVKAVLQAYRTGKIPEGALDVVFNRSEAGKEDEISLKIPPFEVKPLDVKSADVALASEIEMSDWEKIKKLLMTPYGLAAVALVFIILIVAAIFIIKWLRKKCAKTEEILPPWIIAVLDLKNLRSSLKDGEISERACLSKLTDIVRVYLEKRFSLHAPTQTTDEFLRDLDKTASPLKENQRQFMRDFMTAADLVKFANMPAEGSLLEDAMDRAGELVEETRPSEEEDKNE